MVHRLRFLCKLSQRASCDEQVADSTGQKVEIPAGQWAGMAGARDRARDSVPGRSLPVLPTISLNQLSLTEAGDLTSGFQPERFQYYNGGRLNDNAITQPVVVLKPLGDLTPLITGVRV